VTSEVYLDAYTGHVTCSSPSIFPLPFSNYFLLSTLLAPPHPSRRTIELANPALSSTTSLPVPKIVSPTEIDALLQKLKLGGMKEETVGSGAGRRRGSRGMSICLLECIFSEAIELHLDSASEWVGERRNETSTLRLVSLKLSSFLFLASSSLANEEVQRLIMILR